MIPFGQNRIHSRRSSHVHHQLGVLRIKARGPNGGVPTVASQLTAVFVPIDKREIIFKPFFGMQPLPDNAVLIEKPGERQRQRLAGNHTTHDAGGL